MPFYIFKITPDSQLEHLDEKEKYREAKTAVRKLRAAEEGKVNTYRMVFAASVGQGEKLLNATKETRIIGDD
jgi:hypothetical protein